MTEFDEDWFYQIITLNRGCYALLVAQGGNSDTTITPRVGKTLFQQQATTQTPSSFNPSNGSTTTGGSSYLGAFALDLTTLGTKKPALSLNVASTPNPQFTTTPITTIVFNAAGVGQTLFLQNAFTGSGSAYLWTATITDLGGGVFSVVSDPPHTQPTTQGVWLPSAGIDGVYTGGTGSHAASGTLHAWNPGNNVSFNVFLYALKDVTKANLLLQAKSQALGHGDVLNPNPFTCLAQYTFSSTVQKSINGTVDVFAAKRHLLEGWFNGMSGNSPTYNTLMFDPKTGDFIGQPAINLGNGQLPAVFG